MSYSRLDIREYQKDQNSIQRDFRTISDTHDRIEAEKILTSALFSGLVSNAFTDAASLGSQAPFLSNKGSDFISNNFTEKEVKWVANAIGATVLSDGRRLSVNEVLTDKNNLTAVKVDGLLTLNVTESSQISLIKIDLLGNGRLISVRGNGRLLHGEKMLHSIGYIWIPRDGYSDIVFEFEDTVVHNIVLIEPQWTSEESHELMIDVNMLSSFFLHGKYLPLSEEARRVSGPIARLIVETGIDQVEIPVYGKEGNKIYTNRTSVNPDVYYNIGRPIICYKKSLVLRLHTTHNEIVLLSPSIDWEAR